MHCKCLCLAKLETLSPHANRLCKTPNLKRLVLTLTGSKKKHARATKDRKKDFLIIKDKLIIFNFFEILDICPNQQNWTTVSLLFRWPEQRDQNNRRGQLISVGILLIWSLIF